MGEKWFFYSVHDAVVGCMRHQKAKRLLRLRTAKSAPLTAAASTDSGGSEPTAASEALELEEGCPELPLSRSQEAELRAK